MNVIEKKTAPWGTKWIVRENFTINEALFAVILVGRVMSGKNILEYITSEKALVALWQWWLIRFKFHLPIKNTGLFIFGTFSQY